MLKTLKFAGYCFKKNIQNNAELRASFVMNRLGMMVNDLAFIIVWYFFAKAVGVVNGWRAIDIIALQGFATCIFGLVMAPLAGISRMAEVITSGKFDQYLLAPHPLLIRAGLAQSSISAIGDFIFGALALLAYILLAKLSALQVVLLLGGILVGTTVFFAVLVSVKSASFFFYDGESIAQGLFEFFLTPGLFHSGAIQGALRGFFTFVVPSLIIGGLQVEVVRETSPEKLLLLAAIALFWLLLSLRIFAAGVKRYESSNFMTFG